MALFFNMGDQYDFSALNYSNVWILSSDPSVISVSGTSITALSGGLSAIQIFDMSTNLMIDHLDAKVYGVNEIKKYPTVGTPAGYVPATTTTTEAPSAKSELSTQQPPISVPPATTSAPVNNIEAVRDVYVHVDEVVGSTYKLSILYRIDDATSGVYSIKIEVLDADGVTVKNTTYADSWFGGGFGYDLHRASVTINGWDQQDMDSIRTIRITSRDFSGTEGASTNATFNLISADVQTGDGFTKRTNWSCARVVGVRGTPSSGTEKIGMSVNGAGEDADYFYVSWSYVNQIMPGGYSTGNIKVDKKTFAGWPAGQTLTLKDQIYGKGSIKILVDELPALYGGTDTIEFSPIQNPLPTEEPGYIYHEARNGIRPTDSSGNYREDGVWFTSMAGAWSEYKVTNPNGSDFYLWKHWPGEANQGAGQRDYVRVYTLIKKFSSPGVYRLRVTGVDDAFRANIWFYTPDFDNPANDGFQWIGSLEANINTYPWTTLGSGTTEKAFIVSAGDYVYIKASVYNIEGTDGGFNSLELIPCDSQGRITGDGIPLKNNDFVTIIQ